MLLEGVVAYDLLGALKILRHEGWFSCSEYNAKLKNYKLFAYEKKDKPSPLKEEMRQERLKGKAMSLMVHLRNNSKLIFLCTVYLQTM